MLDLAGLVGRGASASKREGLFVYARASSPTSPSSVAEKNIVWRLLRQPADDPVDLRLEAHVEHPVGLVEDEDPDVREVDEPALGEILEAARRGDEDVRVLARLRLRAERDAAVDRRRREALRAGASDSSSSATWAASSRVGTRTSAEGARRRGRSRSTIGIANASVLPEPVGDLREHVEPGERVRQDERLDRKRLDGWNELASTCDDVRGHAELAEGQL